MNVLTREQFRKTTERILDIGIVALSVLVLAMGVLSGTPAGAQTADQAAQVLKPYSAQSLTVVKRLTQLNRLPAEEWRLSVTSR